MIRLVGICGVTISILGVTGTSWATGAQLSGNGACFGDNSRQEITCRKFSEEFLLGLRFKTRDQIQSAMGVMGGPADHNGLHFVSNYQAPDGSGAIIIEFTDDRATIIAGDIDIDDQRHGEFIWNAALMPDGCSDLPGSRLQKCNP